MLPIVSENWYESIEALPDKQQESLLELFQKRLAERRHQALIKSVQEARKEFKSGKLRPAIMGGAISFIWICTPVGCARTLTSDVRSGKCRFGESNKRTVAKAP